MGRSVKQQLALGLGLTCAFMVLELITAVFAGSLAMLGDAAHMMTDAASFAATLGAVYAAERLPTAAMTYGMGRIEVLTALGSTLAIWLVTGMLVHEAILRIIAFSKGEANAVDGQMMTIIGCFGIVCNLVLERVLGAHGHAGHSHGHSHGHGRSHVEKHDYEAISTTANPIITETSCSSSSGNGHGHDHGHSFEPEPKAEKKDDHSHSHGHHHEEHHDRDSKTHAAATSHHTTTEHEEAPPKKRAGQMNIDAAYLHVLGDLLQSVAVVISGVIIWVRPDWQIADPICTLIFAVIVLFTTFELIQSTVSTLLMGAPEDIDVLDLLAKLSSIEGVDDVHDLHVWALTAGHPVMSVHIHLDSTKNRAVNNVLKDAHKICQAHGIENATIQVQHTHSEGCVSKKCFKIEVGEEHHHGADLA